MEWGSVKKWIKHQPLDNIKEYFGAKIALYFAWLGFYTMMLIPASILGIIGVLYGWSTLSTDKISNGICDGNNTILMCPQCDKKCDFWWLNETCTSSKFNYIIDNNYTVFYALFMSIWAVLYLELWKRYSAKLIHRWGLTDFSSEVEHARPQYLERLKNAKCKRYNADANVLEPHPSFWRMKFPSYCLSYSIVLLFICIAIIAFCSLIVYRMAQRASRKIFSDESILLLPLTAGILDLIVITCLDYIYTNYLAIFLTNLEYRRTETEYQESLTIKNYLFQFFNYYSSLFYIAILKGKFVGYPKKYNRIFGFRQEECNPGGCLMELCIQLAIIMIGKQIVNEILELSLPYIRKTISRVKNTMGLARSAEEEKLLPCNQWMKIITCCLGQTIPSF
uniref:Anoctamin n=1 Tax=Megaselia scalaris TaxID=36166 RepID=T1GN26_MEGSC